VSAGLRDVGSEGYDVLIVTGIGAVIMASAGAAGSSVQSPLANTRGSELIAARSTNPIPWIPLLLLKNSLRMRLSHGERIQGLV